MKFSLIKYILFLILINKGAKASVCDDPLKGELCYNMRYLRTQVMALGAQRELMQVNYNYLNTIGDEIQAVTNNISEGHLLSEAHLSGITEIKTQAQNLSTSARAEDPTALATANLIQKKCASCHNQNSPNSELGWDRIFKNDWEHIAKNCAREGRVPFLCRSMNGMMTSYAGIFAASQLGRQNFNALQEGTKEIVRIASDLKAKKMIHTSDDLIDDVIHRGQVVLDLSAQKDLVAFEKGLEVTQSCMQCHGIYAAAHKPLFLSPL